MPQPYMSRARQLPLFPQVTTYGGGASERAWGHETFQQGVSFTTCRPLLQAVLRRGTKRNEQGTSEERFPFLQLFSKYNGGLL